MSVEQDARERLGEVVSGVDGSVHTVENQQVTLNPFLDGIVFDVNVPGTGGGSSSISHGRSAIIVFVQNCGSILWYSEVP